MINLQTTLNYNIKLDGSKVKKLENLKKKFDKLFLKTQKEIKNPLNVLNVFDPKFKFNFKFEDLKKFKKYKTIAIIGMGGSILGVEAIHNFLQFKIKKNVYFFNDLNEKKVQFLKKKNLSKILFIIISKSGNTIETLSNTLALNIIKKNSKNIIIISEKKNNSLFLLSKKFNLFYIEHKNFIGGRYSVLSEVGIVPAYLMGINIKKLRLKVLDILKKFNKPFLKNSSVKLAYLINSNKKNSLIFLNYSPELEKFLFWCQQLIAESLGKKNKGILPVISNVPKDHHSLLQLYLDGPKDKIFDIFSLERSSKERISIKNLNGFLVNKKLDEVKNAQRKALIKSLSNKNIPFREFKIKKMDEETLGKLFSYFVLETVIVAKLLDINPYNQPAVEQVKSFTKKFLS